MLQMTGMVVNIYTKEGGTDKEGKPFEPSHKVQIMGAVDLPNGQQQNELIDLKIENLSEWQSLRGKNVAVDVGIYAPAKNSVVYFIKKGSKPRLINAASA